MDVGPAELLIVLVIVLVLFGADRLPRLARGLGSAIHEYRRGLRGDEPRDRPDQRDPDAPRDATSA
ncbi:MAG TPA: twin-arginine translocase TatA/TatE family subunit [Acidimicrobiales bacterium]